MHRREHRGRGALLGTPRSAARSLRRTVWEAAPAPPPPSEPVTRRVRSQLALLGRNVLAWLWEYLKHVLRPRRPFRTYPAGETPRGVFRMDDATVVALASDWGSGTESAYAVGERIAAHRPRPHYTIHLGDVYYSGTRHEYEAYFLADGAWPRGAVRTFVLNGNHEMYSGGEGYFGVALGELGQEASYFALENAHWRIVALDTGYYARTFPFLELFDRSLIKLHRAIRAWLRDVVFADPADRRPVILLTHHQWFSAFDSEYRRIGRQLAPYLDRVLLWFWGHEHRLAGYAPFGFGGVTVRGRCIGHGGMPIEVGETPRRERNLVFADERDNPAASQGVQGAERLGYCGYAMLQFEGPTLRVTYFDERGTRLLEERWTVDGAGEVRGDVEGGELVKTFQPLAALVS